MSWLTRILGWRRGGAESSARNTTTLVSGPKGIAELRIRGMVDKAIVNRVQEVAASDVARGRKDIKLLIILDDFRGWKRGDDWGDLTFFIEHGNVISQIAVVGDPKWEGDMMMFLGASRRTGAVRFFGPEGETQARRWLQGDVSP